MNEFWTVPKRDFNSIGQKFSAIAHDTRIVIELVDSPQKVMTDSR